jgi:hypothetical protein
MYTSFTEHNKQMSFTEEFKTFCINTICGQESGLYKSIYLYKEKITDIDNIRSDTIKILLQHTLASYLNSCYKSLILKNDTYVIDSFNKIKKTKNHSEICLLNIMFVVVRSAILDVDRHKFSDVTYGNFMFSMKKEYEIYFNSLDFDKLLDHECSGEKIENCDPNEKLFFIK